MAAPDPLPYDDAPAAHVHDTPDTPTIQTLVDYANAHVPRDANAHVPRDANAHVPRDANAHVPRDANAHVPATTGPGPRPTPSRTCW